MEKSGKVYLVGAGPGDTGLITIKGIECIKKADVIIYDRLVNKELLNYRKNGCEIVYVGKKSSNHILPQDKINDMIAKRAKEGLTVVRLKGGDPYVFGRGGEEAEVLFDEGIEFEIVPGVTSAIGGLCYAGIPVTHRDFASSFHVVTGHAKKDDSLDINWKALAEEKGTVIFLMGIGNIAHITDMLISNGRRADTPVAFVSWATKHNQKTVTSTLEKAEEVVTKGEIKAPAIFVVGGVVSLTEKLGFYERKPMFGKTVLVTRTRKKNSELKEKIEILGGRTIEIPTIEIKVEENAAENISCIDFDAYSCIALTSHNAAEYFFDILKKKKIDFRKLSDVKIASIGKATTEAIEKFGVYPDIESQKSTGYDLGEEIIKKLGKNGNKILFPCSRIASDSFENIAKGESNVVDRVEIYNNEVNRKVKEELIETLKNDSIDYITFTSSSTFKNLLELIGDENKELIREIKKASIGEITTDTIEKSGFTAEIEAENPSIDSLIEAIKSDIAHSR